MKIKEQIVEIGKRLYNKNLISGYEGNISVREGDKIYITPSGLCKGFLSVDDIIVIDLEGNLIEGNKKPSSETKMHLKIYKSREDVKGVVHAHPPVATGFACAGYGLEQSLTAETVLMFGTIPLAPYGTPSTDKLPEALNNYLEYNAILLANHGAVTFAENVEKAYFLMEQVEHYAKITLVANILGSPKTLPCEEVDTLMELRKKMGIETGLPKFCRVNDDVKYYRFSRDELVNLIKGIIEELGG
ncbi:L-fuculose-phosphate aldolase [Thermotomaculum hydrothermale]|uniref:L-fuculose-phosphate aldolase n=1 Tax=Thermotomaculum hydrothermale TaxID=981385 RepID=A0A7R6PFQ1_9BACT|nr:class II aldolase/adducin family protein [Thermotomaculum hydrothermale]BBB32884.1 L-fuculose-phosphate aldolase [Thermotomaculum hydrothermale]